jgi:hypothetical protein
MPRTVTVFDVFIASPSDVATERRIVRDVIASWNENHRQSDVMLNPISWETTSLAIGLPQAALNDVGRTADLLIAVFWTRLGTPTRSTSSETLEEIDVHLAEKKPAMFYFSSVPVEPSSVDLAQLEALRRFKSDITKRALIETFDSAQDLREKLTRQLARVVEKDLVKKTVTSGRRTVSPSEIPQLSKEAKSLLTNIARDVNGHLLKVRTFGGLTIQTNGKTFGTQGEPRSEALWESAVLELRDAGLLQDQGRKGEVFRITNKGYEVADRLGG